MQLYDTAARAVRPLEPVGDPVSLYVCGITPYDAAHLGHAFTYHAFDVLVRRLTAAGRAVTSVRNVTDVDDDILRVARERGVDAAALAAEQVDRFDREMAAIGLLPPQHTPWASRHVPAMVSWIADLERAGFAYARDGRVYFTVRRFQRYGSLSRLSREQMIALSRERGADPDDARKRDPLDFVLWQPSLAGEPSWDSPWSRGRPGWHIECSVLATTHIGLPVDVHGGGDDLVYPHHESEIAQVEAGRAQPYVRHWVHAAMVGLDGVKMSKSLGNLVFVRDCLRQAPAAAVRLLLAQHHYRTAWDYEAAELAGARARLESLRRRADEGGSLDPDDAAACESAFFARLDSDLDTPGALAALEQIPAAAAAGPGHRGGVVVGDLLSRLLGVLGIELSAAAAPSPGT